jgi:hypothetical protein
MNDDNPRRVYIGSYEGGTAHIIIPAPALARANEVLDAERARREAEAAKAKLQILQSARNRGRLRKLMRAVFRGHRRIPQ